MYAAGLTDVGVTRSQNQDAIFVHNQPIGPLPNLFIVADGMGGHKAGDVASKLAVETFTEFIRKFPAQDFVQAENFLDLLVSAAQSAGKAVSTKAESDEAMSGMGTTLTACVITNEKVFIVHIGDSRAYIVNLHGMRQLTTDHTFVNELLQTGRVSEEEAKSHPKRHVLTKVLGVPGVLEVDGIVREIGDAAAILLCSDGLSNMLEEDSMMRIINGLGYVEHRTKYLIDEANKKGGTDNISAVLIDVGR
ncbi:MAG: Stp1/IreP family PP2C-type Ser/Thr phosphatase [Defluviitaleaceae bacterium]|nr:Stp1/IreP family PP2C-type Ser/Thr phosphatase [Defluviitaleaceae bacterium]MCL2263408.1 Stp1/IreP family PP2C-type Ser/Thr phosphatase [Defluviitaleaceae bacterium]